MMILFTILSRVTYNMSMATVETTQPARETMGPVIETKAAVEGKQEVAVIAKENQIIQSILVTVGQAVEKDQVLYTLDLKELDKQIKEKSQELELNKAQLANAQNALQSTIDSQQLQISQAKNDYDRAVADSDAAIQRAQEELSQAKEKYDRYIQNPEQFPELSEEQLESEVAEKNFAYQEALRNKDDAVYAAQKAIDSASLSVPNDNSGIVQMEMEKEKIEIQLRELQKIKDQEGEVKAPVKGVVAAIDAQVGARTAGTGDVRLADASAGARIVANFPSEYESYIQRGQSVEVTDKKETLPATQNTQTKLTIGAVQASVNVNAESSEGAEEGITATIDVPPGVLEIGSFVGLKVSAPTQEYNSCIPISALNVGEKGKYYVNILEKKQTVLGSEWVVYKRDVELLFKNEKYAAITGVNQDEEVVTKTSRMLENGMHVKRKAS
ncbi:MAG: efflux RND transporter periplasmic adaptor subunit [Mediterraneibacter gnavus]